MILKMGTRTYSNCEKFEFSEQTWAKFFNNFVIVANNSIVLEFFIKMTTWCV